MGTVRDPRLVPVAALLAYAGGMWAARSPGVGWLLAAAGACLGFAGARRSAGVLGFLALGLLAAAGRWNAPEAPGGSLPLERPLRVRGRVVDDPRPTEDGFRCLVEVAAVAPAEPGPWKRARGRVLLRIRGRPPDAPARGDEVVFRSRLRPPLAFRNPGSEGYRAYLRRRGVVARASARWPGQVLVAAPGPRGPPLLRWRRALTRAVRAAAPGAGGAVLAAVTTGDRSGLDPGLRDLLRRTGTAHLVAISGLHLAAAALLLTPLARRILLRFAPSVFLAYPVEPVARLAALPVLVGYAALSGWQVSTVRALVMLALLLVAGALARPTAVPSVLASTALVIGLAAPGALADPGLHLSLAALAGIFWLGPRIEALGRSPGGPLEMRASARGGLARIGGGVLARVRNLAAASTGAALATLPVTVFHFGSAPLAGIALNVVSVPLVGYLGVPLGLAGVVLHPVAPAAAAWLWRGGGRVLDLWLRGVAAIAPGTPPLWPGAGTLAGLAGWSAVVGGAGVALGAKRNRRRGLFVAVAGMGLVLAPGVAREFVARTDPRVHVWVLDVGQGQAVALRLPGGRWMMVDGGGFPGTSFDVGARVVRPALEALGARRLWVVVSTHPHPDHVAGLPSLVRWGRPQEVWLPASFRGDGRYGSLLEAAARSGARAVWIGPAGIVRHGRGWAVRAAAPEGVTDNDRSLALRVSAAGRAVLLPGDLEREGQETLLASGFPVRADVLVAPHHGASDATWPYFLRRVRPQAVVISAGSRPGLPSPSFGEAARSLGVDVVSTRARGCVHVWFGPGGWGIRGFVDTFGGI